MAIRHNDVKKVKKMTLWLTRVCIIGASVGLMCGCAKSVVVGRTLTIYVRPLSCDPANNDTNGMVIIVDTNNSVPFGGIIENIPVGKSQ